MTDLNKNNLLKYKKRYSVDLALVAASLLCFEVVVTRIASVIFVSNYAFIILSLAILGLGTGGIFDYYAIKETTTNSLLKKLLLLLALSYGVFIAAVTQLPSLIVEFWLFFSLLFLPFFIAGVYFAIIFKNFAARSFKLYTADLIGATIGSLSVLVLFSWFSAGQIVLLLCAIMLFATASYFDIRTEKFYLSIGTGSAVILIVSIFIIPNKIFPGRVPVGNFPEKDIYHTYPDPTIRHRVVDSYWSIYGRADLLAYSHQDVVQQLFVDGAAGSPMFRFSGNVKQPDQKLVGLMLHYATSIPFLFLEENEKDNMLVIGPGGGKEILTGLFENVGQITGVEINPGFVKIVNEARDFNGGIFTDFSNVHIHVKEGRHFIKSSKDKYDLIVLALPSTEQLQNVDNVAMSENYLLTVEALKDYLNLLTDEGRIIFTVHNKWELMRLLTTSFMALKEMGIENQQAVSHVLAIEDNFAPTIVVKRHPFSLAEILKINSTAIPEKFAPVTFVPGSWDRIPNTELNQYLKDIYKQTISLTDYVDQNENDISACYDDRPFFYHVNRGVPHAFLWLLAAIFIICAIVIYLPIRWLREKRFKNIRKKIILPLQIFASIGTGFMLLEATLFQKLVLYLGSPTISLSILLATLLAGMGIGSFNAGKIYPDRHVKRIQFMSILIVLTGAFLFVFGPILLEHLLYQSQILRAMTSIVLLLPFGFLLGTIFPSALQIMQEQSLENQIPWMYAVNAVTSVLGSVLTVVLSIQFGYTPAFFTGLAFYAFLIYRLQRG